MRLRKNKKSKEKVRRVGKSVSTSLQHGGVPHTSYVPDRESKPGELKYRWDILNYLIKHFGYNRYLEIGVCGHNLEGIPQGGENFKRIKAPFKSAVDPVFTLESVKKLKADCSSSAVEAYAMISDKFFIEMEKAAGFDIDESIEWDIIFIDSDHRPEQAIIDFRNCQKFLADNGTIVFHDAYPNPEYFKDGHIIGGGKGAIWEVIADIHLYNKEWTVWTLALDNGIGIARKIERPELPEVDLSKMGVPLLPLLMGDSKTSLKYIRIENVSKYAKELLNFITLDEFRSIFS